MLLQELDSSPPCSPLGQIMALCLLAQNMYVLRWSSLVLNKLIIGIFSIHHDIHTHIYIYIYTNTYHSIYIYIYTCSDSIQNSPDFSGQYVNCECHHKSESLSLAYGWHNKEKQAVTACFTVKQSGVQQKLPKKVPAINTVAVGPDGSIYSPA